MDYRRKSIRQQNIGYAIIVIAFILFSTRTLILGVIGGILIIVTLVSAIVRSWCPYCGRMSDTRLKFCGQCGGDLQNVPDDLV